MMKSLLTSLLILLPYFTVATDIDSIDFMTEEYPPYNLKQDGQVVGIAVDMLRAVFEELNLDAADNIRVLPWARGYANAQDEGSLNVIFSTTRTEDRESLFKWAGPISDTVISVLALKKNNIKITQASELGLYKAAVIRDDIGQLLMLEAGVAESKLSKLNKFSQVLKKVENGRAQLLAYEKNVSKWLIKQLGKNPDDYEVVYTLKRAELWYAFNKSVADSTVAEFQAALDKVRANTELMQSINATYLK